MFANICNPGARGAASPPENAACKVPSSTLYPEFWGKAPASPAFTTTRDGKEPAVPGPTRGTGPAALPARPQGAVRARRLSPGAGAAVGPRRRAARPGTAAPCAAR